MLRLRRCFFWELCCTVVMLPPCLQSQVRIENRPPGLEISEPRLRVLHETVCRAVAEALHVHAAKVRGQVIVVLGAEQERTVADGFTGVYTIYLNQWDETAFLTSDTRLAIQRLAFGDSWDRLIHHVVLRARLVSSVDAVALHNDRKSAGVLPVQPEQSHSPRPIPPF